jgi:hypothetical protein
MVENLRIAQSRNVLSRFKGRAKTKKRIFGTKREGKAGRKRLARSYTIRNPRQILPYQDDEIKNHVARLGAKKYF